MARSVLVDSAGLYALADHRDPVRAAAEACVARLIRARATLFLTDYIIDEAATLAKARAGPHASLSLLELVDRSAGFSMIWIGPQRFQSAKAHFRKHADHGYSFTDCTSFVVMRELGVADALTTDHHFVEAGFKALLPVT
jgi:predicted nucleic acid-binding protein